MLTTLVELVWTLLLILYYYAEAAVRFFTPKNFLEKNVKGQKVLITGAGSGIGRLMAYQFAELGADLVLLDLNETGNLETCTECQEQGAKATAYTCDVSKRENVYNVADKIKREVGDIDILVNNAGIVTGKRLLDCPDHLIQKTMDVNALAHFWLLKSFLPSMKARNHGHVVTIASVAGHSGLVGLSDYCASKFAAVGLHESLLLEMDEEGLGGVKATCVCPGLIDTGLFAGTWMKFPNLFPKMTPEFATSRIMSAILTNQEVVILPRALYLTVALKGLMPSKAYCAIGRFFGYNKAMASFTGRGKKE